MHGHSFRVFSPWAKKPAVNADFKKEVEGANPPHIDEKQTMQVDVQIH